ncbi:MAG TPA: AAA family ATPase [Burkholderiales bacterium]|nr:AAA family ATPase [Burkholderiales bacterium]
MVAIVHPPERRQLTVMLCDLVGYTGLSLRLDAEELADVIQAHRQRCTEAIASQGGSVAQYVGDGVLAYFGYPQAHEDDAERAIRAALAIVDAARAASQTVDSNVHIGIATGPVVIGNLSADRVREPERGWEVSGRDEVSAIGSALNLASRLQVVAGPGMVVVSEQTRRLAGGMFDYRDLGLHPLKGFDTPIQAWHVLGEGEVGSRFHALRASALTPLVNRRAELKELRQMWGEVRSGKGRAVFLSGEAGVGKSRMAEVIASDIVDPNCARLRYYFSPHLQSSPLAPLIRRVAHAAGFAEGDDEQVKLQKLVHAIPEGTDEPHEFVPLIASLLSIDYESKYPPLRMSAQRLKQRLFDMLSRSLESLASRRPVLLVAEDLHWVDPSSEELIGLIVERLQGRPILAVLTARPEYKPPWKGGAHLVHMPLRPLKRKDSIDMIGAVCAGRDMPEATVNQIAEQTDGVPLFIEDLTREVLELEDLQRTQAAASRQRGPMRFAIPASLSDSLTGRLDRLGPAKRVAQTGAAIGREFSYELMAKLSDLPEESLKDQLDRLVESGLLIHPRSPAVAAYRFKHALVRDAAYSSLLKREQTALHGRIARILAEDLPQLGTAQPEVAAYHFEAAQDFDRAVEYLVKAAELSAKRSGFVEAISQLDHALSLLGTLPKAKATMRRELRVYLALGAIYAEYRGFSATECGAAYTKALSLCRELGDAPEIFSVLSGAGSFEITRANFETCRALAEECLSRAAQQESRPPFVMGHRLLGGTLFLTGEFAAAREHLEQALAIYEEDESLYRSTQVLYVQDHKSTVLCYLALTLSILGYLDSGLRAAESGLSHSQSLGDLHTINFSLCYLAAVHHIQRDAPRALQRATESLELAREQGFATWVGISQVIRGEALIGMGRGEEGMQEIASGMKAHAGMEATAYQAFGISLFVKALLAANRLDDALGGLARALAISEKTGEHFYVSELLRLKGEILAKQGRLADAEDALRSAVSLARKQGAKLFELRSAAGFCKYLKKSSDEVREMLAPVYDWFDEGGDATDLKDARALLGIGVHR